MSATYKGWVSGGEWEGWVHPSSRHSLSSCASNKPQKQPKWPCATYQTFEAVSTSCHLISAHQRPQGVCFGSSWLDRVKKQSVKANLAISVAILTGQCWNVTIIKWISVVCRWWVSQIQSHMTSYFPVTSHTNNTFFVQMGKYSLGIYNDHIYIYVGATKNQECKSYAWGKNVCVRSIYVIITYAIYHDSFEAGKFHNQTTIHYIYSWENLCGHTQYVY